MSDIRLVTLNCQKGWITSHREELGRYLSRELHQDKFDFIFLQEVSETVWIILTDAIKDSSYKILSSENPLIDGVTMQTIVLYKSDTYVLQNIHTISFATRDKRLIRPEFGLLGGVFIDSMGKKLIACSFHLHASFHVTLRLREIREIKEFLLRLQSVLKDISMIFLGGDANSGLPWESSLFISTLNPELIPINSSKEYTASSDRLEPSTKINKFAVWLAKLGIIFKLKTDYIFANRKILDTNIFFSKVIDIKVSDHRPVEVFLKEKSSQ